MFGIIGLILLVIAWIPQTIETIKRRVCPLDLRFLLPYTIASILLTIHAIRIGDIIFSILNLLAFIQSLINLIVKMFS